MNRFRGERSSLPPVVISSSLPSQERDSALVDLESTKGSSQKEMTTLGFTLLGILFINQDFAGKEYSLIAQNGTFVCLRHTTI